MLILGVAVLVAAVLLWWRLRPAGPVSRRGAAVSAVAAVLGVQALIGVPAVAAPTDCAPNPERPGSGVVAVLDATPLGQGQPGSIYDEVGYAGLTWHLYNPNCGAIGSLSNPSASIDTWLGSELFNATKVIVGATNGLHYALLGGNLVRPLDDLVAQGSKALYQSVFAPLLGLAALLLAVLLFRRIWRGDLAGISTRVAWALAALWLASATYLTPLLYTEVLDKILIAGTSDLQAGFLHELSINDRDALPSLLHQNVVYRNWLRGEFGSLDAPQAKDFGTALVHAQAFTKQEIVDGKDAKPENATAKKQEYVDIRGKLANATGYFDGTDGSRTGNGFLALLQAFVFALFPLLAKAAILFAQVVLRVVVLTGPLIGLAALLYPALLSKIGKAAGAALLHAVILSALAGVHALVITWIFDPTHGIALLPQMLLGGLVTVVLLAVSKPVRRIAQMMRLAAGTLANTHGQLWSRMRTRRGQTQAPHDVFWNNLGHNGYEAYKLAGAGSGQVWRPEATAIVATDPATTLSTTGILIPSSLRKLPVVDYKIPRRTATVAVVAQSDSADPRRETEFSLMGTRRQWRTINAADSRIPAIPRKAGDSALPDGCPVYYKRTSTAIGYDSKTLGNSERIRPLKGWHDIVIHGVPADGSKLGAINFAPGAINTDGRDFVMGPIHPNHIIDAFMENPEYADESIRLVSCHTATAPIDEDSHEPYALPLAQILANRIGRPVKAPTGVVGTNPYGEAIQDAQVYDGNRWVTFLPLTVAGE